MAGHEEWQSEFQEGVAQIKKDLSLATVLALIEAQQAPTQKVRRFLWKKLQFNP
jgi:hypothetical protein